MQIPGEASVYTVRGLMDKIPDDDSHSLEVHITDTLNITVNTLNATINYDNTTG